MAVTAESMTPRGASILRSLRANFAALDDHAKLCPAEVDEIVAGVAAHVRSWRPLERGDRAPTIAIAPDAQPVAEVERSLGDDHRYKLTTHVADGERVVLLGLSDGADTALVALTDGQARTFIDDARRVLAAIRIENG